MAFKIGISTLCTLNKPLKTLISLMKEKSMHLWEFVDDGIHFIKNQNNLLLLKEITKNYNIELTIHAPYAAINISATNPLSRKFSYNMLLKTIDHARELNCKYIVFHPGLRDAFTYIFTDLTEPIKESINLLIQIGDLCSQYGITPLLENLSTYRATILTSNEFKEFFKQSNKFKMVLDIPHAHITKLFENYLLNLNDYIEYFHISDNNGEKDMHWALDKGVLDWRNALNKIKNKGLSGPIIIENLSWNDVQISLNALNNYLT